MCKELAIYKITKAWIYSNLKRKTVLSTYYNNLYSECTCLCILKIVYENLVFHVEIC